MSKQSNLTTVRQNKFFLNTSTLNNNFFLLSFNFLKAFKQLLLRKKVLLLNEHFNFSNNKLYFKGDLFYESNKLSKYKKKKKVLKQKAKKFAFKKVFLLLKTIVQPFNITQIITNFKVLNTHVNKKFAKFLFKSLKKYMFSIFIRRFKLFVDFIKLTALYFFSKIELSTYLYYISEIFKYLRKYSHAKFLVFLKKVFSILIKKSEEPVYNNNSISGIKFILGGRIKGKQMASNVNIQLGRVAIQKLSNNITFAKVYTFTKSFGVFGFKIWVCRKN